MRRALLLLALTLGNIGCSSPKDDPPPVVTPPTTPPTTPTTPPTTSSQMQITINSTTYTVTLADNTAARTLQTTLPLTLRMADLNENEKYAALPRSLPTASQNVQRIEAGDLMLFGSNTLVFFYKSFTTSYTYTPLGRVNNPATLASTMGRGDITVTFETPKK